MKVEYLDKLGTDLTVVNAARVSFGKWKETFDKSDEKLIQYLAKHGHWSPFAHPQLQLRVTAPIFVARQLSKHTVGLVINEISRRYVDYVPNFYVPVVWRGRAENKKQGSTGVIDNAEIPISVTEAIWAAEKAYDELLEAGVAPEQARMVLPQNLLTQWIWTGSLYAFARVCNLRLSDDAQEETKEIARQISAICVMHFPASWEALIHGRILCAK